jgi:hypothetical protein
MNGRLKPVLARRADAAGHAVEHEVHHALDEGIGEGPRLDESPVHERTGHRGEDQRDVSVESQLASRHGQREERARAFCLLLTEHRGGKLLASFAKLADIARRADDLGARVRSEDGVGRAVEAIARLP